jgi:putative endonuclease
MDSKTKTQKIKTARRHTGDEGEDLALAFLAAQGFSLLERNWQCRSGEIDLVLQRENVIHFVEVKTRRTVDFGYPEESITWSKKERFRRAIGYWRQTHPALAARPYKADACFVLLLSGRAPDIQFLPDLFF